MACPSSLCTLPSAPHSPCRGFSLHFQILSSVLLLPQWPPSSPLRSRHAPARHDTVHAQEDGLRPWKCGQRIPGAWVSGVRSELLAWAAEWTGPLLGTGSWEKGRGECLAWSPAGWTGSPCFLAPTMVDLVASLYYHPSQPSENTLVLLFGVD